MTEHASDRLWSGIQISKVVAGTLAALSAAVLGSFLGVAGTLAGAALASIVGTVGTEVYQRSLDRGAKKLQTLAPTFIKAPAAVGTPEVAAATDDDSPSHTVPEVLKEETPGASPVRPPGRSGVNWKRVGLAAVAVFILAMVPLTIVEMASGRTLANLVGSSQATGTSLGTAVTGNEDKTPATTPTTAPSETPSDEETTTPATDATSGPAETPATTDPATEPTTAPTTEAPTTDAPQETTPADPPQDEQQPEERSGVQDPQQGTE